jgi:hypothetical protein
VGTFGCGFAFQKKLAVSPEESMRPQAPTACLTMFVTALVLAASSVGRAQMPPLVPAGSAPQASPQLQLKIHPHKINFGKARPLSSVSHTVTLTNHGSGQIMVGSLTLAGGVFSVPVKVCSGALNPGASCSVPITFRPVSDGAQSGVLQVVDNASGSPQLVTLRGRGKGAPIASPQTFVVSGTMLTPRQAHTATGLNNGLVLLAGGIDQGGHALASAELFDPTTGHFTATGALIVARSFHSATLLPSGQVLIAGGEGIGDGALSSAELYDSTTGKFTPTASMSFARLAQSATLLATGAVLIAGGADGNGNALASAELFNSSTGLFSPAANLAAARLFQAATVLGDGNEVLLVGGNNSSIALASAELFQAGVFAFTGPLATARTFPTVTLLTSGTLNGRALAVGGFDGASAVGTAELFDPVTDTFPQVFHLNLARLVHTATLLTDGNVLIAGGQIDQAGTTVGPAELFNEQAGAFAIVGSLNFPRTFHTATLLPNGTVLIAGGIDAKGNVVDQAELFEP